MIAAAFVSGAACAVCVIILGYIAGAEYRAWKIRRRHKINRLVGRSILHRI